MGGSNKTTLRVMQLAQPWISYVPSSMIASLKRYKFPLEERILLLTHYYHSPDITLMDFCIWGLVKDWVFAHDLQTIDDLKNAISAEFNFITRNKALLRRMVDVNYSIYLKCIEQEGKHFKHLL